jgi:uncharacterized protein
MKKAANKLGEELSPYLLQHAYNPVDWYPWGEEALQKAKNEDKPILVSIGYSSCHWCHVMERESFEDVATAEIMNQNFVNIKIDREERPDLDHLYMDAVQAITGSGGWPLNVFLTPDLKPFYGGTYYPPVRAYNRASWKEVLHSISQAFSNKRSEIEEQAQNLTEHLKKSNSFEAGYSNSLSELDENYFTRQMADTIYENIMKSADREWGGFSRAPKFPQTFAIRYLLQYYHFTGNEQALKQACLSLDKMIQGGIYDHAGGGFSRYSTDSEWFAPHFEKMLYDNALLIITLSEAFQLTKNNLYRKTIEETLGFIASEMTSANGGFYSALDADSEGVEGKYYTWTKEEITNILKDQSELFCSFFDVSESGNWEGKNILHIKKPVAFFCAEQNIDEESFAIQLKQNLLQLKQERHKRIRPLLDDKIILGWNALMNSAYSKAFQATGNEHYQQIAVSNMKSLLQGFKNGETFYHVMNGTKARGNAFLDDYAWLIQALLDLQEITSNPDYLIEAKKLTDYLTNAYSDEENLMFYYTENGAGDVIVRKKEVYDGAVPSANSVMAHNLYYLGFLFDNQKWIKRGAAMAQFIEQAATRHPVSFANWARLILNFSEGFREIAVIGKGHQKEIDQINQWYLPNKLIQGSEKGNHNFPFLNGKKESVETPIFYLCKRYSCQKPADNLEEFKLILGLKPV